MPHADPERNKAYQREWARRRYAENPEPLREKSRIYRSNNRDAALAATNRWRLVSRQKILDYEHSIRDKRNARKRIVYTATAEKLRTDRRKRYLLHKEQEAAWGRSWREAHPGEVRRLGAARRARKANASGSHTVQEWTEKCELFANLCVYCGVESPLTRDHKVPLTRGGTDYIDNIVPACAPCNSRKRTRTAEEFLCQTSSRFAAT